MSDSWAQSAARETNRLGPPDIIVSTQRPSETRAGASILRYGITRGDFDRITKSLPTIQTAVPVRTAAHEVRNGERAIHTRVVGSTGELASRYPLELARGRFLTDKDVQNLNNVAVLAGDIAGRLFPDEDPLGESVRIQGHYWLVVGVTKSHGGQAHGRKPRTEPELYVPFTTMQARFGDRVVTPENGSLQIEEYELSEIRIMIKSGHDVSAAAKAISRLLRATHEARDFSIEMPAR